jgi:hypothetical protein
MTVQ